MDDIKAKTVEFLFKLKIFKNSEHKIDGEIVELFDGITDSITSCLTKRTFIQDIDEMTEKSQLLFNSQTDQEKVRRNAQKKKKRFA